MDSLVTGEGAGEDLHTDAVVRGRARAGLVDAEDGPGRIAELVVVELRGKEGRVEGQLNLGGKGRKLEGGHG